MPRVARPPAPPVSLLASIATDKRPWQNEKDALHRASFLGALPHNIAE